MPFSGQTFSANNVLFAASMNQLDENIDAVRVQHIGSSPPPELVPGLLWLDNSTDPWKLKIRDASSNFIDLFRAFSEPAASGPIFHGARVAKTSDQSIPNDTLTKASWDSADFDTDGFFNNANDSLDIPHGGISRVELAASIVWQTNSAGSRMMMFRKNGADFFGQGRMRLGAIESSDVSLASHVVDVSSGDQFTVHVFQNSGGSLLQVNDLKVRFSIQVVL